MIQIVVVAVVIAVLAVLVLAATRPASFRVERKTLMRADVHRIHALIDDFAQWPAWSPWEKYDPAMRKTRSGAPRGAGAIYEWQGNGKVGQGRMEILESTPPTLVRIRLDFVKPFEAHNTVEFTLYPIGDAVQVAWAMFGPSPFSSRLMGLFMNMDRMIGRDFEAGLANLKSAAER